MIIRSLEPELLPDGSSNPLAGDWQWGQGRNNYKSGNPAIGQNIQSRLLSFLGDCYFSLQDGVDWLNLFGSPNQRTAVELAVNGNILQSYGVKKVLQLSSTVNSLRKIFLTYEVETIYSGITSENETVSSTANYILTQDGVILTTEDGQGLIT